MIPLNDVIKASVCDGSLTASFYHKLSKFVRESQAVKNAKIFVMKCVSCKLTHWIGVLEFFS